MSSLLPSMGALDILRETVRILRASPSPFLTTLAILIIPTSTTLLSPPFVTQATTTTLSRKLIILTTSSGLQSSALIQRLALHLSSTLISSTIAFPLLITALLTARSAVAFAVASSYASKDASLNTFVAATRRFWRRPISTYLWSTAAVVFVLALFLALLILVCNIFAQLGYPPDIVVYPALIVFLGFAIAYAHTIIVCNLAGVIAVLEDVSGPQAMIRSVGLIRGQTQAGLMIFLGTTIGLAFVEGLFEHRVKTLSYGDGSSRIWEGPLLVVMYSFVVLLDSMMSAVFYFSCRSTNLEDMEVLGGEEESDLLVNAERSGVEMHSIK